MAIRGDIRQGIIDTVPMKSGQTEKSGAVFLSRVGNGGLRDRSDDQHQRRLHMADFLVQSEKMLS